MSPSSRPVRDVKVLVPRHNSQRLGPATIQQVEVIARKERKRVDVRQTASDPSSILAQAIVSETSLCTLRRFDKETQDSASEWNSLLMTARAERGPQWDIGTQQYVFFHQSRILMLTSADS